jgi:membrane protease subunit (stomatin/prohibitin family)
MTILGWLLAAAALAFVGWPLFRARVRDPVPEADAGSSLERQKREAYAAIKEAELDRRMGKLSDEDFAALTSRYRQQALAAIAALDLAQRSEAARRGRAPTRMTFCPDCGEKLPPRANFCSHCGRSLRETAA